VGWRWCTKNMHDPNGLLDTRSANPREPASITAVGLDGILSEVSSTSSQKRRTSKNPRTNVKKPNAKREIEKFIIRQPPMGEKDDYDSENSWISDGTPTSEEEEGEEVGGGRWESGERSEVQEHRKIVCTK